MQDERLIELISGSLDGMLNAEEKAELQSALDASAEARDLLAQLSADQDGLRALPPLKIPPALKQRALLKTRAKAGGSGVAWRKGLMMAASVAVVFGLFWHYRPLKSLTGSSLFLRPGLVALKADKVSQELHLAARGPAKTHQMVSEAISGDFNGGVTRVTLKCDAGKVQGGRLSVTLAFDFDGDGHYDVHSEPQILEVDGKEGYQEMACTWPAVEGMKDLQNGTVQVEVACLDEKGPPLKVKLEPKQAKLELPFDHIKGSHSPS